MKTITLRKVLAFRACDMGIESYCKHLGMPEVKTLNDLFELSDAALDAERPLADYLQADTRFNVIWAIRCLDDWHTVAVEFARGCADAAAASAKATDACLDVATAKFASYAAAAVARAAKAATTYAAATTDDRAASASVDSASASASASADYAAGAAGAAGAAWAAAADAERARQVEHLRELLSTCTNC